MAALTAAKSTDTRVGQGPLSTDLYLPVATSTTIYQGGLVALNASGYAKPAGGAVTTERVAGIAQESVVNSGANGAKFVRVKRCVAKLANLGADAIAAANLLTDCYAEDDQTVRATNASNARSRAGKVIEVGTDGVWVETY